MNNEYDLFKKLIDDDMLDYNAIMMKYYKKLNITEKEIFVLSSLIRQEAKGNRNFNPSRIKQKIMLSQEDFYEALETLTEKGYIDIKMEYNTKTLKDGEVFYLDNLYKNIVNLYLGFVKKENEKKADSFNEVIANFFEELYKIQMSPLDIDIIKRWGEEKQFSIDDIKTEMINASKLGKASLRYVDQSLIKNKLIREQSPEYKETNEIIEELKNKWKK